MPEQYKSFQDNIKDIGTVVSLDNEVEEVQVLDFEDLDMKGWVLDGVQVSFSDGYANGRPKIDIVQAQLWPIHQRVIETTDPDRPRIYHSESFFGEFYS